VRGARGIDASEGEYGVVLLGVFDDAADFPMTFNKKSVALHDRGGT
jgi:hypothetical protein